MLLSIHIITEVSLWFALLCVLLGGLYAFFLYHKENRFKGVSRWLVVIMTASRFLLVTLLAFLLLSPFVKTLFNKVEKPIVVIAQDNSASILMNKDAKYYQGKYLQELDLLEERLASKYEVRRFVFGQEVVEGDVVDYDQKITNISNLFEELNNKFYNKNVGALIMASDGIFNQGKNPVYSSFATRFPVYVIAMGDTAVPKDIVLKEVSHNEIAFLGNQFPLKVYVETRQLKGERTILKVRSNGKTVFTKEYVLSQNNTVINEVILLTANKVGVQHFNVSLSVVEAEISDLNNERDIYVEVLDGRQNILILANAPHPDLKALKLSIEKNENYKVSTQFYHQFDGNVKPYSLVVLHQMPVNATKSIQTVSKADVAVLYLLGTQTNVQQFNQLNVGLHIASSRHQQNLVQAQVVENFPLFTLTKETKETIASYPPLLTPFGEYKNTTDGYILLNQKIGSVVTENPLIAFYQKGNKKVGVISGEGIWKWRMQNFLKDKNHQSFDELINKIVQFLAVKEDKSRFRILTKHIFLENEEIIIQAELYNSSYELINEPDVKLILRDDKKRQCHFEFNKTSTAYLLNAGILPVGFYRFTAETKLGKEVYMRKGKFQISPILFEANNTVANHQLLQNIVTKNEGKLIYPHDIGDLEQLIDNNKDITALIYEEEDLKEFIQLKWIFFLLLTLLSLEWFLRKRNGAY